MLSYHKYFEYQFSFRTILPPVGILCVIIGVIVFAMDKLFPTQIAIFFGVDVLQDSESLIVEGKALVGIDAKCGS